MVTIQMVEMKENKHEVELFKVKWSKFPNANVLVKPIVNWSKQFNGVHKRNRKEPRYQYVICDRPWNFLVVKSDGTVPFCAHDIGCEHKIGDVNREPIEKIWNAKEMQSYRNLVAQGKHSFELCSNCEYCYARPRNFIGNVAIVLLDMLSIVKILFVLGYKK